MTQYLIPPILGVVGLIAAFIIYGIIKSYDEGSDALKMLFLGLGGLIATLVLLTTVLRKRGMNAVDKAWGNDAFDPMLNTEDLFERESMSDLFEEEAAEPTEVDGELNEAEPPASTIVPEGWTLEAFTAWLDGPLPEGWTSDQWTTYVEESKATLAQASPSSEG